MYYSVFQFDDFDVYYNTGKEEHVLLSVIVTENCRPSVLDDLQQN